MKITAITMALAVAALSFTAAQSRASQHHARANASGASPAYWGVERKAAAYRSCTGWCWPRQSPGAVSMRQVDPRLRARSDGRLLEEVGAPPPPPAEAAILPYSYGPVTTVIPWRFFFWNGHGPAFWRGARGYRFTRGRH